MKRCPAGPRKCSPRIARAATASVQQVAQAAHSDPNAVRTQARIVAPNAEWWLVAELAEAQLDGKSHFAAGLGHAGHFAKLEIAE
jgi:hypothetical protein